MYGVADNEIAVHLYGESTARAELSGGKVTLTQETQYPWDGAIKLSVGVEQPTHFALSLRIPAWAKGSKLAVNGQSIDVDTVTADGYARIERDWQPGDSVRLDLPLVPRALRANPKVRQDAGRVAVMRGPLVYCLEGVDNAVGLNSILLGDGLGKAQTATIPDFNGAIAIDLPVLRELTESWGDELYGEAVLEAEPDTARLVPYHLWDNRAPGEMLVWLRQTQE